MRNIVFQINKSTFLKIDRKMSKLQAIMELIVLMPYVPVGIKETKKKKKIV